MRGGCYIKIKDIKWGYDLIYIKDTTDWTVEKRDIDECGNVIGIVADSVTVSHQTMMKFMDVQPTGLSVKSYSEKVKDILTIISQFLRVFREAIQNCGLS